MTSIGRWGRPRMRAAQGRPRARNHPRRHPGDAPGHCVLSRRRCAQQPLSTLAPTSRKNSGAEASHAAGTGPRRQPTQQRMKAAGLAARERVQEQREEHQAGAGQPQPVLPLQRVQHRHRVLRPAGPSTGALAHRLEQGHARRHRNVETLHARGSFLAGHRDRHQLVAVLAGQPAQAIGLAAQYQGDVAAQVERIQRGTGVAGQAVDPRPASAVRSARARLVTCTTGMRSAAPAEVLRTWR